MNSDALRDALAKRLDDFPIAEAVRSFAKNCPEGFTATLRIELDTEDGAVWLDLTVDSTD